MAFLNELKKILGIRTSTEFARMCSKQLPNMTNYLNGNRDPGSSVLEDCLLNATASRIFDNPPGENTRLGKKAKKLRSNVLNSTISNLFGEEIRPLREVEPVPERQNDLPRAGGVYILYDSAGNVLYVGKATSFRNRVWRTLDKKIPIGMRFGPNMSKSRPTIWELATYMSLYQIENSRLRHNIEALLIRVFINQTHNSNIGKFKTKQSRMTRP